MPYEEVVEGKQGGLYWISDKGNKIYKARLRKDIKKNNLNPQSKLNITQGKYILTFN
tara:strand:+ start:429 stop:599 length:171 start_codon:yes stop_codon:yes gene_type:complete